MRTVHLVVDGMRCRRCVRQVTALLRDVPGVVTVVADGRTGQIRVSGEADTRALLDALAGTAFIARTDTRHGPV